MPFSVTLKQSLLAIVILALTGCANLIAPMGTEPIDNNHGKRTFGAKIEDQNIERKIKVNLYRRSPEVRETGKVKVISMNGNVLLVGEVEDKATVNAAGEVAKKVRHVRSVHNELAAREKATAFSGISDAWITSKAKTRLLLASKVPGRRTKVVTRRGVVYIMGLLTRAEADAVTERIQRVYGIQKIVKIIEYIDMPE